VNLWRSIRRFVSNPVGDIQRRWDAARTTRLNSAHWQDADGENINRSIEMQQKTLRDRCLHEAENNAFIEGMIHTYCTDVAGPEGPQLTIQSDSDRFSSALEEFWYEWFESPDYAGLQSGADKLRLWTRQQWTCGEFFEQIVYDTDASSRLSLRLHSVNPRRVETPPNMLANPLIVDGVERNFKGKPIGYHVMSFMGDETNFGRVIDYEPVGVNDLIHGFQLREAGQAKGVPWLAPILDVAAEVRDFDKSTLDAARTAADFGVLLYTEHPDSAYVQVNESVDIKRRKISTVAPGWKVAQVAPQHPSINHVEYRKARIAELGRVVSMPLMMIMLDASGHNYSSARFDGQVYIRGVACFQKWLQFVALNRLVREVHREAMYLDGRLRSQRKFNINWTWPTAPHVDPTKEAKAMQMMLDAGLISEIDACAALGYDYEAVVKNQARVKEILSAAGVQSPRETKTPQGQVQRMEAVTGVLKRLIRAIESSERGRGNAV